MLLQNEGTKGSLELLVSRLIANESVSPGAVIHQSGGEQALIASAQQIKPYLRMGGVVHYQRNLPRVSESRYTSTIALDLLWIQTYFGDIVRLKSYTRGQASSRQLFITLRLANQVIVQYTLNSLGNLKESFSFDFSSKGYNLEFDDQVQSPLTLNLELIQDREFVTELSETDINQLKQVIDQLDSSLKGGN